MRPAAAVSQLLMASGNSLGSRGFFDWLIWSNTPMFKKSGPPASDPLANRLRQIAAKPALEESQYEPTRAKDQRAPRQATFKQGTITLSGGERVDVVVKNVSDTGMRVEFFRKVTLTDQVIIAEPTLRIRRWARVMWQTEGAAGLQFIEK